MDCFEALNKATDMLCLSINLSVFWSIAFTSGHCGERGLKNINPIT
jgi:hypothetical protein